MAPPTVFCGRANTLVLIQITPSQDVSNVPPESIRTWRGKQATMRAKIAHGAAINRYLEPSHLMEMSGTGASNVQKECIQKFMLVQQSQIASSAEPAATMILKG